MQDGGWTRLIRRHKERLLFLCALVVAASAVAVDLSGRLEEEDWDATRPLTGVRVPAGPGAADLAAPDFSLVWTEGGRNPFGDAAAVLESGGRAKIRLPLPPPLLPEMPPAPLVRPIDLLMEGSP